MLPLGRAGFGLRRGASQLPGRFVPAAVDECGTGRPRDPFHGLSFSIVYSVEATAFGLCRRVGISIQLRRSRWGVRGWIQFSD
ncbi:hypothetical protein NITLEN_70020 [Nitrospira lenta]|uniref:Uncharacterized protein n=1 Tax=Nitrospira lenta TaxID=1436998 RepID=A0A330LAZ0_9BACT|nr:hypothetical protein NITLEN_70020 [Nitrospira lenta]